MGHSVEKNELAAYLNGEKAGRYEWIVNEQETAAEYSPIDGLWKEYWIHGGDESSGQVNDWPSKCFVNGCTRETYHGTHVRDGEGNVYIVRECE